MNNTDDNDLFSYDNSNNIIEEGKSSFDLNSFSSKSVTGRNENRNESKPKKGKNRVAKVFFSYRKVSFTFYFYDLFFFF